MSRLTFFLVAGASLFFSGCTSFDMPAAKDGMAFGTIAILPPSLVKHAQTDSVDPVSSEVYDQPPSRLSIAKWFGASREPDLVLRMQSPDLGLDDSGGIFLSSGDLVSHPSESQGVLSLPNLGIRDSITEFATDTLRDHQNFYSLKNLPAAAAFLGAGALMANTQYDQSVLEHIQDNITFNSKSNEYQEFVGEFRFFGEGYFLIPIYFGSAILGKHLFPDNPKAERLGEWGDRCVRSIVIGAPPLILGQMVLGASRPGESPEAASGEGSEWQFFEDNNGISGHAFMGAVPFLTAYHMTENKKLKVFYFVASTLPALSRITENGHYPSQALLGWGLAYMATSSVGRTENSRYQVAPYFSENGIGLGVTFSR